MSLPVERLEPLAVALYEIGAVRFGRFVLHSGRTSPIYLDLRLLASYPAVLRQVAAVFRDLLATIPFDLLAATPLAGLPIGTAVALEMEVPLVYPRPEPKRYGTGQQIEGKWEVGQWAVILDDLITSGDSLLQGIAFLKAAGLRVANAVVLIDREQGGREALEAQGYQLYRAMTIGQLLAILERKELITARQRARVLKGLR
ncbi:MAG: orotate phosphoribosyltransferase [Candidatus Promineifilaceae bacterium]|nr:orotate phosphoribosyltransferase [Candidatus Promineifilaceae bacterium]